MERGPTKPLVHARAAASPRARTSASPGGAAWATPEADEKYIAYMKALRIGRQNSRIGLGAAPSSAEPSRPSGVSGVKPEKRPVQVAATRITSSIPPAKGPKEKGTTRTLPPPTCSQEDNPQEELRTSVANQRSDSPHSDSSDSIDFEVQSIGHVRSVNKSLASASATSGTEGQRFSVAPDAALEIRELHRSVPVRLFLGCKFSLCRRFPVAANSCWLFIRE